jgi:hypothetical protein
MSTDAIQADLGVNYQTLKTRVGRVLGVPADEAKWTESQLTAVRSCISDGLRQYYNPPQVDNFAPHEWSFLTPTCNLTTAANQRWYALPDDFESLRGAGMITYSDQNEKYSPIQITNESHMRQLEHVTSGSTSFPRYAAVRAVNDAGVTPQQWELGFDPTPDAAYALQYSYHASPQMLTDDRPYPLGGKAHGQGLLLSCLAAAERYEFDSRGEYWQAFMEQLKSDIAADLRRGPTTLGYGGVHRRGGTYQRGRWPRDSASLTTGGVTYRNTTY